PEATQNDYAGCDAYGRIRAAGLTARGVFSVLAHPTGWLDLGVTYTMHANINATGNSNKQADNMYPKDASGNYIGADDGLHAYPPSEYHQPLNDPPVPYKPRLPDALRLGARAVMHYPDGSERADVEIDVTWENWSSLNQPTACPDPIPADSDGA